MTAAQIYRAYVTAILVIFVGLGMAGFIKSEPTSVVVPQFGSVVEGVTPLDGFNDDVVLDTSQVKSH